MKGILCFIFTAVDCQLGDWSDWSSCSVTCGHGQKIRIRYVKVNADHGGKTCSDERQQRRPCFSQECRKYYVMMVIVWFSKQCPNRAIDCEWAQCNAV